MSLDEIKEQARILAALTCFLDEDVDTGKYSVFDHNVCSAYIEYPDGRKETLFSYSNPSRLKKGLIGEYEFIIASGIPDKIIARGGMQDLHTEVRLLNFLYEYRLKGITGAVINFFSMRSVCDTCRAAIYTFMKEVNGRHAVTAYEFKIEKYGCVTDYVYPITPNKGEQAAIKYV